MDIHRSAQAQTSFPQSVANTAPPQRTEISADFQTFLRMLTTQMQNQNPLEPIEASDFAVQLATFSGVEQQVRTNELLTRMMGQMGLSELSEWINRDVLTSAPVYVDGTPISLVVPIRDGADHAELVFRNAAGVEAARYAVAPDKTDLDFTPPLYEGGPFAEGFYRVEIETFRGGTLLAADPVLGYSKVAEARLDEGLVKLVLDRGHIVESSEVMGTRR